MTKSFSAIGLLHELRDNGATVSLTEKGIRVRARFGRVSEELQEQIRLRKEQLREALQAEVPEAMSTEASHRLHEDGWALVRSEALAGELVLWVLDDTVEVPQRLSGLVRYTRDELAALEGATEDHLREIHQAKRALPEFHVAEFSRATP